MGVASSLVAWALIAAVTWPTGAWSWSQWESGRSHPVWEFLELLIGGLFFTGLGVQRRRMEHSETRAVGTVPDIRIALCPLSADTD